MRSLNLVVLRCRDIDVSRRFYEALGLRFTKHAHGGGPEHYAHEDERGVFELYPATKEAAGDMTGLGFSAENLEAVRGELSTGGFAVEPIKANPWGRTFVVRDTDGRRVEVKQAEG